jgi:phosphoribosylamine--glycine ligase
MQTGRPSPSRSLRVLGVGETNDLGDMYLRLANSGAEVRVHVSDPAAHDVLAGLVHRVEDWRAQLPWIREAGDRGLILFEGLGHGAVQDQLRREGFHVIGGGEFGDRLEGDRDFGQRTLQQLGMRIANPKRFSSFDAGLAFLREHGGRWVFKLSGSGWASQRTYVGELDDAADMIAFLSLQRDRWAYSSAPEFILMERIRGVEMGVGAYFDGEKFLAPACLDWEHKAFFPGNLGELTGEMGTLVTYRQSEKFFAATLAKLSPLLREHGHVGYLNLNTIVNDEGIWPLEFTSRFGYPGFAILDALQPEGWADLFERMISRRETAFPTRDGWAVGVVLTVPPFPYSFHYEELSKGMPVSFRRGLTDDERARLKLGEVGMRGTQLVTAGQIGYAMVATGRGESVSEAQAEAYALASQVVIPRMRYRNDIADGFLDRDGQTLRRLGWIS